MTRRRDAAASTLWAPILAASVTVVVVALDPPPFGVEHTRPIIQEVAEARLPTDEVWSYYGAAPAMDFYGGRLGLGPWEAGECHRSDPREYLTDLDALRGHGRVWIVFTHVLPMLPEREVILAYLREIGSEQVTLEAQMDPVGTSAYLFDLSDPERLANATAATFDLGAPPELEDRLQAGCERGPLAPRS